MTAWENNDPYYDLFEDWDLIVSSFLTQYGLRLQTAEFETVSWDEFKSLLSGLAPDTPLGRVVAVRAENDREVLKRFTKEQHKIRNEWRNKQAKTVSLDNINAALEGFKAAFIAMAGDAYGR